VFPVRYELNLYILFRRNPFFKGLTELSTTHPHIMLVKNVSNHQGRKLQLSEPQIPYSYSVRFKRLIKLTDIILPMVLYGCETWSLTLREKHRLKVFENRVLRMIFGPKTDEVRGGWRKLHNEELYT
jgi:hypothetical protein